MEALTLSDGEFAGYQRFIYAAAGIHLSAAKKALVTSRLARRLHAHGLASYGRYLEMIEKGALPEERQLAIDLLTTNETYFFREPKHFDFLRERVLAPRRDARALRVWSAACSSGEEPYSIAMVLAGALGEGGWEVLGSDISARVLEQARVGRYRMERARHIPKACLAAYCLKGVGAQAGSFMIAPKLRARVRFARINLNEPLPNVGEFEVIFLRNVMIYFDAATKQRVVERLVQRLRPGGYLFTGHSETLNGVTDRLAMVVPSVYRKP